MKVGSATISADVGTVPFVCISYTTKTLVCIGAVVLAFVDTRRRREVRLTFRPTLVFVVAPAANRLRITGIDQEPEEPLFAVRESVALVSAFFCSGGWQHEAVSWRLGVAVYILFVLPYFGFLIRSVVLPVLFDILWVTCE